MRASLIVALELGAIACATIGHAPQLPPLDQEGELVVELQPLPPGAERLFLEIGGVSAVRADGVRFALQVLAPRIGGGDVKRQRMVARGRLEPAQYSGIAVARPAAAQGAAPTEPEPIAVSFAVTRQRATVVQLRIGSSDPAAGAPVFSASIPARTLPQVATYCTDFDSHDLAVLDKLAHQLDEVLPTGRGPWGVAIDGLAGRAYVTLSGEDQISVVDVATGDEVNRIRLNLGDAPRELALTPDGRLLLSANAGSSTVSFIDPAAIIEVARVAVGQEPTALLVDRRGARAYVTNRRSSTITVLDVVTRAVAGTLATDDQPLRPQIDRAGNKLYVLHPASAFLLVFSLPDFSLLRRVYIGLGNTGLKIDPATDLIYIAKSGDPRISVYDPFSLIPVAAIDALEGVTYMAIDDAQNALFALAPEQRAVAIVELSHRKLTSVVEVGTGARVLTLVGERN